MAACRAIVSREAGNVAAHQLLGLSAVAARQGEVAIAAFDQAIRLAPRAAELHVQRGQALRMVGRVDEAVAAFRSAVGLNPALADAHHQLGNALKAQHQYRPAAAALAEAARLTPNDAVVWLNLGVAQLENSAREDAVSSFRRAIALEPSRPEAHNVLGAALMESGQIAAAMSAFGEALRLRPGYAPALNNQARAQRALGRISEAIGTYQAALKVAPDPATHSNLLYALNFSPELSADAIAQEHREWGRLYADALAGRPPRLESTGPKPVIRVGLVSPDFLDHAVAYFLEPLLATHDPSRVAFTCYSDVTKPDLVTARLRRCAERWRDIAGMPDEAVANLVRQDNIDVLIDLAGHTAHNRLLVFARKPAPIQVTWLGYPNTTGVGAIGYRITDSIADPIGLTDRWHVEKLWRMPRAFLCYLPPEVSPPVAPAPVLTSGRITFGSFSNITKVSEPCVRVWSELLVRVPGSRLRLKSRGLGDAEVAAEVRARFGACGIAGDRIELDGQLAPVAEHLGQYRAIDIALDPFPYNGTTTTCEALWMGVPVVSLSGHTHVARVGTSLLTQLRHPEWIADSPDRYVEIATELAQSPARLARIRDLLRDEMRHSPLCDAIGFAREFEDAFRAMLLASR